ncbi:MAG: putative amidase AmiA2 [Chroococcopsis gigantea SAG 12.99]|jgi:amidase|nr:putative amidase AmiA2 [Chroococcopsis gigantea SAG 12.99]
MSEELAFKSALELGVLIKNKIISPLELTQLYLDRIERLDGQLGSFVSVAAESALTHARNKTEELASAIDTDDLPPFFGIPIGVKDLNAVAGMPITYGVAALKGNIAQYDEAIVTKLKAAGCIILGKTATSQLGSFPYTECPGFLPTRNPWHTDYTAGGSSGGSASAVAAGLCAIAQGSDGGGSIRTPANCCGLVGIKPARGRVSYAPVGEYQSGISSNGILARTVADAAALLDVISGYVTGDPYWLPNPPILFSEATTLNPHSLKIGFTTSLSPFGRSSQWSPVEKIVGQIQDMGHTVKEIELEVEPLIEPFKRIWQAGAAAAGIPLELLSPLNQWLAARSGTAGEYLRATQQMHVISRGIVAMFQEIDVLLLPVLMKPPIRVAQWENLSPEETVANIIEWIAPCPLANASGLPAIALPVGFDGQGLPTGIQLVGKPGDEITLIALATVLESLNPFDRIPPRFVE